MQFTAWMYRVYGNRTRRFRDVFLVAFLLPCWAERTNASGLVCSDCTACTLQNSSNSASFLWKRRKTKSFLRLKSEKHCLRCVTGYEVWQLETKTISDESFTPERSSLKGPAKSRPLSLSDTRLLLLVTVTLRGKMNQARYLDIFLPFWFKQLLKDGVKTSKSLFFIILVS